MKSMILAVALLVNSTAFAYQIRSASYDRVLKLVTVDIAYEGGLKYHEFKPVFDACDKSTSPYGLAVRLEDTGWDDVGQTLSYSKAQFFVDEQDCLPAELTIFVGHSHFTIGVD